MYQAFINYFVILIEPVTIYTMTGTGKQTIKI